MPDRPRDRSASAPHGADTGRPEPSSVAEPGRLEQWARTLDDARGRLDRARRSLLSPSGIRGTVTEATWLTVHLAMYPFGMLEERTQDIRQVTHVSDLPPVQRGLLEGDVEAAGTPIVLVHGIVDNHTVFHLLRRSLGRRGFGRVVTVNYSSLVGDIRVLAASFAEVIEQVCDETGYERVHVVGHSMGGLVARYYVQRMGGDARVHTLVTLGTPHEGSQLAHLLPLPLVRQLQPDSELIRELHEPAPGCRTRFLAIWSDLDQLVVPKRHATVVHDDLAARNVFVRGVGHMSLPVDGRVVHEICTTLAHLDSDGTTVAVGATSIASSAGKSPTEPPTQNKGLAQRRARR